jgi:hypothetical protein
VYAKLSPVKRRHYRLMVRDPELFARGTVRHPDHATITLHGWHRVVMNTEQRARHASRRVRGLTHPSAHTLERAQCAFERRPLFG